MEHIKVPLNSIAHYSSKKIDVNEINLEDYVSTTNMLQEKAGITKAESLPSTNKVNLFNKNDILISNIRPYFKKIWLADRTGGCDSDVLNIRAKDGKVESEYLYYTLFRDDFFQYVMVGAKGVKMPRGDKSFIMKYEIPLPNKETQLEIISKLSPYFKKIKSNNQLINLLDEYCHMIFYKWFIEYNFPNKNGSQYKKSGGDLVEQEGYIVPKGWSWVNISEVAEIVDCLHSKKPSNDGIDPDKCLLQLENISSHGLLDLRNLYMVTDEVYSIWTSRIEVSKGDLVITNAGRVGALSQIPEGCNFGIGRNITAIRPTRVPPTWFYLYFTSKIVQMQIKRNTDQGSFFGSLNVRGIKMIDILLPNEELLIEFERISRPLRAKIEMLNKENQLLEETRDLLIKKLIK